MKRKFSKMLFVILAAVIFISLIPMTAAGTGNSNYIQVYTKSDLNNIRNNLSGSYILMNDIVFTDADFEIGGDFYNDGMGWLPIGGEFLPWSATYDEFTGVFDGNGYSIKNLKMNRTPTLQTASPDKYVYLPDGTKITLFARHYFGLFTVNAGTIRNLNLDIDFNINANPHAIAGGICGLNSGLISDCKVSGELFLNKTTDEADSSVGGIAGYIGGGTITFCANEATIGGANPGENHYINCGGIIGGSTGIGENVISYCYNSGNINVQCNCSGFIGGITARSFNDGNYNEGFSLTIENCYNAGILGNEDVEVKIAGICAEGDHEDISIINCYNAGQIYASGKTAGIVLGQNHTSNCYYLTDSADCFWRSFWGSTDYIFNDLSQSQMKTKEAFEGFDFDNVWIVDSDSDYPYPQLTDNRQSVATGEKHNYVENIITLPSCTENGVKTLVCKDCGFELEVILEAEGHNYNISAVTAPACAQQGFTVFLCECGDSYTADFVAPDIENHAGETEIRGKCEETCAENGYSGDTYCLDCNTMIKSGVVVPSTGAHIYVSEITTPATHLTEGVETFTCVCKDTYTNPLPKLTEHSYNAVVTAPTCTEDGYTTYTCACTDSYIADYVTANGHNHIGEITTPATHLTEGVETFTCVCKDTYTNPLPKLTEHSYNAVVTAPTCTEDGYTTYTCACTDSYIADYVAANGHNHIGEITTPATHLTEGVETFTCVCKDTYTNPLPKLTEHSYNAVVTAPTCTEDGYTTYTCACTDSYIADYVTANGHNHIGEITTPATHLTEGVETFTCVCKDTYTNPLPKLTGHTYTAVVIAPTCTSNGYTSYICVCTHSYVSDYVTSDGHNFSSAYTIDKKATCTAVGSKSRYCTNSGCSAKTDETEIPATGHSYGSYTVIKSATCTTAGSQQRTCQVCKNTETATITKLGHNFSSAYTIDKKATCTAVGSKSRYCTNSGCSAKTDETKIPATGHSYGSYTVIKSATCTAAGSQKRTCQVCKNTETATITKLGHSYSAYYTVDKKATCTAEGSKSKHCTRNGCTAKTDVTIIAATGHSYGLFKTTKNATCTSSGAKQRICSVCNTVETEIISKLGHSYSSSYTVDKEATCTTAGSKSKHCIRSGCTAKASVSSVEKLSHAYKTATTKATLSKNGSIKTDCTVCGNVKSNKIISYPKTFTLSATSFTYNGNERNPYITIKDSAGNVLKKNTDYTVTYDSGRKNVGTYNVSVKMIGNYTGTKILSFRINKKNISACTVTLSATSFIYNGNERNPYAIIKDSAGNILKKNTDYTVTYDSGRKNVGTYNVSVKMIGNYTGTKTLSFRITPKNISACTVTLSATSFIYNGNERNPYAIIKDSSGNVLKKNTDYTVAYSSGRKNVGTYKVTVTMKGNYAGTKILTFKINPPKTTLASLKAGTKSITVNLNKQSTQTTGYQIQYSTNKNFTNAKTKTVANNSTLKTTLSSLSSAKTYYVRVRTYKTVNDVKYYSGWSQYKYVKTK